MSDRFSASALAADGIPLTALTAYQNAAAREATRTPSCGLSWPLLAGIGRVESDHGRFAGAVLHTDGLSTPRVIGIPLNGQGSALIRDTDNGVLDGDTVYDRAVGPMQFIPSTWAGWGVDANGDGLKDPFNIFDAAAAAADYLCAASGGALTTTRGQVRAILSYNHSWAYVAMVMGLERVYASGVGITVPVLPTTPDRRLLRTKPGLPPADPGAPVGATSGNGAVGTHTRTPTHAPLPTKTTSRPIPSTSATTAPDPSTSASSPASTSASDSPSPSETGCPSDPIPSVSTDPSSPSPSGCATSSSSAASSTATSADPTSSSS